ncbi:MAG: AAA family ATPase [Gammaproteobacteria bacterium]|jgi:DNA-binding SARP family transcriptional activator
MESLELQFLGDLKVVRDGQTLSLPPSRKTRALLAYLALNERRFRREFLCELLWELPDDPRGSLRWSLSKLRRLVDDDDYRRIVADRSQVEFDPHGVAIDVLALKKLAGNGLSSKPDDELEQAAKRYNGYFLEGLELTNFHEFHAWCVAERELATQARVALLTELVRRKSHAPEDALTYVRELVSLDPYSESARENLIRLLMTLGRVDEAKQQYALGARLLTEIGAEPTGTLKRALESMGSQPKAAPRPPTGTEVPAVRPQTDAPRDPGAGSAIVGRNDELQRIEDTIRDAIGHGETRLVLLRGEPGIGKSRLVSAALEMARRADAWVLHTAAYESESIRPFALWIDSLRQSDREVAERIFAARDGENRERLFAGLSDSIAERARKAPVALLLDDLQWCDEASATALHYVARTNRQLPVFGVLAARQAELQDNAAVLQALNGLRHAGLLTEIELAPLAESEVRALIEQHAPDLDSADLSRECGGNPLIAIELARAEISGDSGESLKDLVRERLARFPVDAAEILRWAAVIAPRIDISRLERASGAGVGEIGEALELAERLGIVQPTEHGYRFAHDLVAASIYTEISPARRRMMHRRIAELLEQDAAVELELAADLAHHASQSGDPGLAARAMVSAGRLCLRFYSNDEAMALARRGLTMAEKLPDGERVRLTIDLEDVMLTAAPLEDWESAVEKYVSLAEQALDHGAMAHARRGYYMASYVRWMHGHWSAARDQVLQAERVSRGASDEDHIVGMAEAARCLALLERDLAQADAMLMEAQALASRKRIFHHSIPAALGMLRYHENRFDEAETLFQEARALAKSAGDRISEYQSVEHLIMIEIERGDFAAASTHCVNLLDIGEKLRFGSEGPFARALAAICDYALEAETGDLESAFAELRDVDAKHRLAYALTRAAMLDVSNGRHASAVARATEALQNAQALDRPTDLLLAHVVLTLAHQALADEPAVERHSRAIAEIEPGQVAEWARIKAQEALA